MARAPGATPWGDWLCLAVLNFRLTPETFWRMSLEEWRFVAGAAGAGLAPLHTDELTRLMAAFPDNAGDTK